MPGIIPHTIAGCTLFVIGRYYYRNYFDGKKVTERLLLFIICMIFTFLPDFFLAIYYTTHLLPKDTFMPYHNLTSIVLFPGTIIGLIILTLINTKRKPIWIMGLCAILFHIIMDIIIQNETLLF